MKITPIDIQQAGFKVRFRGYDRQEVDTFLDTLTEDYETFIRDNSTMKEKIADLEGQLGELKKKEASLTTTLVRAEDLVGQMHQNAQKEAELITKDAEIRAEAFIKGAHDQVGEINREILDLKKQKVIFTEKIRSMISSFQTMIEVESKQDKYFEGSGENGRDQEAGLPEEKRENPVRVLRPNT